MGEDSQDSSHGADPAAVRACFDELAELEPAPRQQRLDTLRAEDPPLADEVGRLLDSLEAGSEWLERFAIKLNADGPDKLPEMIGPFRILGRLGSGGMGTVYRARRADGEYRQDVALKVVRHHPEIENSSQRFLAERQILARLEHPGIARLIDGGSLPDGSAYLAMELVDGVTIDRYCQERQLSVRDLVQLVIQACEAVDYAHRNLVIHRDIKPANILVDDRGRLRLLDFGIARLTDQDDQTRLTGTGLLPMTPEYASPEQFAGEPVTVASDVYALGALFYRLLTGSPPLPLKGLSLEAMLERVRHQQPQRPSELIGRSKSGLPADLDAIVLMAVRKEPDRRYGSAAELAADLQRFLNGSPVFAHPDSLAYRAGKFVRRHRWGVSLAALFVIGLSTSAAVAIWQARQAGLQRDRAELESNRAGQVLAFLQNMLRSASPEQAQGREMTVRDLVDRTASEMEDDSLDPVSRAEVLETLALTYLSLGVAERGQPMAAEAADLLEQALGDEHPRTLAARHRLAQFSIHASDYERAIAILEPVLEARRRVLGDHLDTASTMQNLAIAYAGSGRIDDALDLDLAQLDMVRILDGPESKRALTALINVGADYHQLGRYEEAAEIFAQVWEAQVRLLGERHPVTLSALNNLAVLLRITGQEARAEERYLELIALRREVLGDDHPQLFNSINNLGELYMMTDRPEQAEPLIRQAFEGRSRVLGPDHEDTLASSVSLSRLALRRGALEDAESLARSALQRARAALGENAAPAAYAAAALVESLIQLGRLEEAQVVAGRELERRMAQLGPDHPDVAEAQALLERAAGEQDEKP